MAETDLKSLAPLAKHGTDLGEKLKAAKTVDDVVSVLQAAGVKTTKAELIRSQAKRILDLSDAELEGVAISNSYTTSTLAGCVTWVFGCCG